VHPRQPRAEIGIRPELVEDLGHFSDKAHLDIGPVSELPMKYSLPFSAPST